jgi:tetratricopeptide (TPR) repeat protein
MTLRHDRSDDDSTRPGTGNSIPGEVTDNLHDKFLDMGFRAERAGKLRSALLLYEKAVAANPDSAVAWYNYGDVLLAQNKPSRALEPLQKAVALSPDIPLYHYDLGRALYDLGRYNEAKQEFAGIVKADPHLQRASSGLVQAAMTNLALSEDQLENPLKGVTVLRPALQTAEEILYNLARLNLRAKKPALALPLFQAAALLAPRDEPTVHGVGSALMDLGRHAEAIEHLRRATRLDRKCEDAWYSLGVSLAIVKRNKEARSCFKRALLLNRRNTWTHYGLACLAALEGHKNAAFSSLEKALTLDFDNLAHLQRDKDLRSLRQDARWKTIVKKLREKSLTAEPDNKAHVGTVLIKNAGIDEKHLPINGKGEEGEGDGNDGSDSATDGSPTAEDIAEWTAMIGGSPTADLLPAFIYGDTPQWDFIAKAELKKRGLDTGALTTKIDALIESAIAKWKKKNAKAKPAIGKRGSHR